MSQPLVSVIIPSYNYGQFVGQAVDSALSQTYSPIEIIVVDDGSQDDTRERLASYGDRIRYVHQQNQGLSAARNTGIREARGEYLAFLDSDDAFHPRKVELQMKYVQQHQEVNLLATEMFSEEPIRWSDVQSAEPPVTLISLEAIAIKPRFAPSSVIVRKKCFETVGDFDTTLRSVEDREMWLRIATRYQMARIDLPLTWYRFTPGSMSSNPERMEHYELLVLNRAFAFPQLRDNKRARRLALSHCYRSSAYTFYSAGRYREALHRLWLSIRHWPFGYDKTDQVPAYYRCRLLLGTLKRWLFSRKTNATMTPGGTI